VKALQMTIPDDYLMKNTCVPLGHEVLTQKLEMIIVSKSLPTKHKNNSNVTQML